MLLGAEIGLLVYGIYAFFTGKLTLGAGRVVYGSTAQFLGIVSCAPLVLSFLVGVVIGAAKGKNAIEAMRWNLVAIEVAILVASLAVIYAIGWVSAETPVSYANPKRLFPQEDSADVPPPAASRW